MVFKGKQSGVVFEAKPTCRNTNPNFVATSKLLLAFVFASLLEELTLKLNLILFKTRNSFNTCLYFSYFVIWIHVYAARPYRGSHVFTTRVMHLPTHPPLGSAFAMRKSMVRKTVQLCQVLAGISSIFSSPFPTEMPAEEASIFHARKWKLTATKLDKNKIYHFRTIVCKLAIKRFAFRHKLQR